MSSSKHTYTVMGFQYEPERSGNFAEDDDDDNESMEIPAASSTSRINNVGDWCSYSHCVSMSTEKECICCHEVNEIKYFRLNGESKLGFSIQMKVRSK